MEGQEWLRSQLTAFNCAACGRSYVNSRIRLLAQRDDHWFVSLKCYACGAGALGLVTVKEGAEHAAERPTLCGEFTPADVLRLAGGEPVGADDLIETHRFLEHFDGDFRRLFGAGEGP